MADETTLPNGARLLPIALGAAFIREHGDGSEVWATPGELGAPDDLVHLVRTIHLPFERAGRIHLADPDPGARELDLTYLKASVLFVKPLRPARYVIHPSGLRRWEGRRAGEWDILVRMLRRLADETRSDRAGPVVIENNRTYWKGIPEATPVAEADRSTVNRCFGETPEEWGRLQADVDRHDVLLCLDLSHATTSAHLLPAGRAREDCLRSFLAHGDRIAHVHWSDNFLQDNRGRDDSHAYPGRGTLPRWFQRAILGLPATFMFEVDAEPDAVLKMLDFVNGLTGDEPVTSEGR